jgi:hypothetical protein
LSPDADAVGRDAEDRSDPVDHRCAINADLGRSQIIVTSTAATAPSLADESGGMSEKLVGRGTPPARITRREMRPDIAGADRSKHRVRQGVKTDIGVGVTHKARLVRDLDAANSNAIAWAEGVHVEALTDANVALSCHEQPLGSG